MTEPIRVLYAEDNPYDADLTQARFTQEGAAFQLDRVATGEACLARVSGLTYDVLLLDYRLPDMDGLDLLKRLMLAGVTVPTVMVTGLGDEEVVVQALRLGASDYVPKSQDYLDTLPDILRQLTHEARQRSTPDRPVNAPRRQILYVERHAMDIDLTARHFAEAAPHMALTVATTCGEALERLAPAPDFDLVLVDLRMVDMSALDFMREVRHRGWRVPVIIISGQGDEETAVAALKLGAADYLVKRENYLTHLPFAIEHAIEHFQLDRSNVELRREITERQRVESALRESEERYRLLFDSSLDAILLSMPDGSILAANLAACQMFGQTEAELKQAGRSGVVDGHDPRLAAALAGRARTGHFSGELTLLRRDGTPFPGDVTTSVFDDQHGQPRTSMIIRDISERKQTEEALQRYTQRLENLHAIDRAMLQAQSPRAIAEASLQRIERLIPGQRASIVAYDQPADEGLVLAVVDQDRQPGTLGPRLSWSATYGARQADLWRGQPIIVHNVLEWVQESPALQTLALTGIRRVITMPLLAHSQLIGVLNLASNEAGDYSREQLDIIQEVADQLALAMHQAQLYEQIQRHAAELEVRVVERTAELARQRERLRAILDAAGDGMVFTNLDATIEYINPAMERLTGYTSQEALGQNPRIWQGGQTPRAVYEQLWAAIASGETWRGEMINRRRDGTLYDAALTVAPLHDAEQGIVGYVAAQRDITRQKELDRLKDQFVSNVSHELRTPLTNIMLYVNLLDRGKPDRREHYLATLQREAERLKIMIEDLLDLSRLDHQTAPIEVAAVELHQLLGPIVADRTGVATERGLRLEFLPTAGSPLALAEVSRLTQVISNLITNALNYTPAGGSVTIQTHRQRAAGHDWLTVTVRDTGPGIAAHELPYLFKRFYRGEVGRRASAPGTGLGLAISREIMERLGGRITVESEPGQGAAFTAWLQTADEVPPSQARN